MSNLEELQQFKADIDSALYFDDELFGLFLQRTISCLKLSDEELSEEFDMSMMSISKWKNGVGNPHPAIRKHILNYFNSKLLEIK